MKQLAEEEVTALATGLAGSAMSNSTADPLDNSKTMVALGLLGSSLANFGGQV